MPQNATSISNTTIQPIKSLVVTNTQEINDVLNYKSISASVSRFSAKLYSELLIKSIIESKEQHENMAYSPICIHLMLALIMLGSHGKTKTELIKVLRDHLLPALDFYNYKNLSYQSTKKKYMKLK